ncbi:MAG: hypothetical protein FJ265_05645 [Planctomycetes bacterium]|nr:hypothetical protein [Planctomycetota bacterium]
MAAAFGLVPDGALLVGDDLAVRINRSSSTADVSNTVVALRKLLVYDDRPVVVCTLSPAGAVLRLANSSFVAKVSHSSHGLTEQHLVGSINSGDVLRSFEGLPNAPEYFAELWRRHRAMDQRANLGRIVAATRANRGRNPLWSPDDARRRTILAAPALAARVSTMPEYAAQAARFAAALHRQKQAVFAAAAVPDGKSRGDAIERLVTGKACRQGLGDVTIEVATVVVAVDVKSKRLDWRSAPKGYSIDKLLRFLADGNRLLAMLFVGVDPHRDRLVTRLCSIFDRRLLRASRIEKRWSGRDRRGTVQFRGDLEPLWADDFCECIDTTAGRAFLLQLLDS